MNMNAQLQPAARLCLSGCVALTHWAAALSGAAAFAQPPAAQEIDFAVYSEQPRLFLTARRLRLLQREKERESMRWAQFDALVQGNAQLPNQASRLPCTAKSPGKTPPAAKRSTGPTGKRTRPGRKRCGKLRSYSIGARRRARSGSRY